jgi:DNA polymerase
VRSRPSPAVTELLTYLADLGYEELLLTRPAAAAEPVVEEATERLPAPAGAAAAAETLAAQAAAAATCTRCRLAEGRRTVVFGMGSPDADLMFIGEGPGAQEDRQGLPFVGPAGELLTRIIEAIQLRREEVYIANIVKCRPPGNRDPKPDEVAACREWLHDQIETVRPRVIVMLGKVAAQTLLGSDETLGRMRGTWHRVRGIDARATYHPAALLRNTSFKRPTWEDMQVVRDRLRQATGAN